MNFQLINLKKLINLYICLRGEKEWEYKFAELPFDILKATTLKTTVKAV